MIKLAENEFPPYIYQEEKDIRMNICNNIRWLYIELYDNEVVSNVKEFARQCNTPQSTAESWLRRRVVPHPETRKMIEQAFGLMAGSLISRARPIIEDWDVEYYKRNGGKPSLRLCRTVPSEKSEVSEESHEYGRSAEKDLVILCNELQPYLHLVAENKTISKIVQFWGKAKAER